MPTRAEPVTPTLLRKWRLPTPGDSKRSRGTALIIGGSASTPGAVMLAGLAALRVGAGVLSLGVPRSVAVPLAMAVPESGVTGFDESTAECWAPGGLDQAAAAADAILVGPGLDSIELAAALLEHTRSAASGKALALDAYALGALANQSGAFAGAAVLSPNKAEAARLLDIEETELEDRDDAEVAVDVAAQRSACVSYQNIVADQTGRCWDVASGHPGLGTSGSGDVLAGAIVGLLARGAETAQAAVWGTHLHVTAGDRLASRVGPLGYLARELTEELPAILAELEV